jgi:hypothetical protein
VRLFLLPTLAALGCGRFGFEPRVASDAGELDARDAVETIAPVCPIAAMVPDPLPITGSTFSYTSFDNMTADLPNVTVTARVGGTVVGMVQSGANTQYSLPVPTGGMGVPVVLAGERGGYYTTTIHSDLFYDRPVAGQRGSIFRLGDIPIWDVGAMGSVYSAAGEPLDSMRGTLNVAVRDCAGAPVAGVTVTVTPAPRRQFYQAVDGAPGNMTATVGPFTHLIGLAAPAGMTKISASGAGLVFQDVEVPVLAGTHNTLVVIHGAPEL